MNILNMNPSRARAWHSAFCDCHGTNGYLRRNVCFGFCHSGLWLLVPVTPQEAIVVGMGRKENSQILQPLPTEFWTEHACVPTEFNLGIYGQGFIYGAYTI